MPIIGNASGEAFAVSREAQMAIYDELPPRWRRLVGQLPSPQDLTVVQQLRRSLASDDEAFAEVIRQFKLKYPGWSPEP